MKFYNPLDLKVKLPGFDGGDGLSRDEIFGFQVELTVGKKE